MRRDHAQRDEHLHMPLRGLRICCGGRVELLFPRIRGRRSPRGIEIEPYAADAHTRHLLQRRARRRAVDDRNPSAARVPILRTASTVQAVSGAIDARLHDQRRGPCAGRVGVRASSSMEAGGGV